MNWIAPDLLGVLWFLLPGFVASWVFGGLTSYPRQSEFERVIRALIFTAFSQVGTLLIRAILPGLGAWFDGFSPGHPEGGRALSIVVALLIGLVFALLANHDGVHRVLRIARITSQTGFPSEWFGAFRERGRSYVILHLSGERRLVGWPEEWPTDPDKGHFSMAQAAWVGDDNSTRPLDGVGRILVPAAEVSFVEFLENPDKPKK